MNEKIIWCYIAGSSGSCGAARRRRRRWRRWWCTARPPRRPRSATRRVRFTMCFSVSLCHSRKTLPKCTSTFLHRRQSASPFERTKAKSISEKKTEFLVVEFDIYRRQFLCVLTKTNRCLINTKLKHIDVVCLPLCPRQSATLSSLWAPLASPSSTSFDAR